MNEVNDWADFYFCMTFIIAAIFATLVGVVLWCVLLIPWFLYWLIVSTVSNGYTLLWSNGIARFFSK